MMCSSSRKVTRRTDSQPRNVDLQYYIWFESLTVYCQHRVLEVFFPQQTSDWRQQTGIYNSLYKSLYFVDGYSEYMLFTLMRIMLFLFVKNLLKEFRVHLMSRTSEIEISAENYLHIAVVDKFMYPMFAGHSVRR